MLKKFEQWIISQNLKPKQFIFPLDRILFRFGWKGPPLIYLTFIKLALLLSVYWFLFFPLTYFLFLSLVLQDLTWLNDLRGEAFSLILMSAITSIFFGFTTSYLIKRVTKKHPLPVWNNFLSEQ